LKRKTILAIGSIILLLAVGIGGWVIYGSKRVPETMTESEFSKLKDKKMEVVDTKVFLDKDLEKWYFKNRQKKGVYVYPDGDDTYILVSLGRVKDKKTLLMVNGVKESHGKLLIGYDSLVMKNAPSIKFEDDIRSTLIRVQGKYDTVKVIDVKEGK
jgi:hypothetical protein